MKGWFEGEVKVGPSSALLGFLVVVSACIFVWQLVSTGDPAEASTLTGAAFTALFATVMSVVRSYQAVRKQDA